MFRGCFNKYNCAQNIRPLGVFTENSNVTPVKLKANTGVLYPDTQNRIDKGGEQWLSFNALSHWRLIILRTSFFCKTLPDKPLSY